jgi:hypothetical protein
MNRYLMLLGIAIVVFSLAGGSIELSSSYNEYQSHIHAAGGATGTPLTALDEARWQVTRLVGGGIIAGGAIAGSMLMGLAWIGRTMEQVRDALHGEPVEIPSKPDEAVAGSGN